MPDENGNPTVEEAITGAKTLCASMDPIVEWMKAQGVLKLGNNGLALELDLSENASRLREQNEKYRTLLMKHGLLDPPQYRYAVPDMPREPVRVAEED